MKKILIGMFILLFGVNLFASGNPTIIEKSSNNIRKLSRKDFKNYKEVENYLNLKLKSIFKIIKDKKSKKIIFSNGQEENMSSNEYFLLSPQKQKAIKYYRNEKKVEVFDREGRIQYVKDVSKKDIVSLKVSDISNNSVLIMGKVGQIGSISNVNKIEFIDGVGNTINMFNLKERNIQYLLSNYLPLSDKFLLVTNNLEKKRGPIDMLKGSVQLTLYDKSNNIIWKRDFAEFQEKSFENIQTIQNNKHIIAVGFSYGDRLKPNVYIISSIDGAIASKFGARSSAHNKLFFSENENIIGLAGAGDMYIYDVQKKELIFFKERRRPYKFIDGCVSNDGKIIVLIGNKDKQDELLYFYEGNQMASQDLGNNFGKYNLTLLDKNRVLLEDKKSKEIPYSILFLNELE